MEENIVNLIAQAEEKAAARKAAAQEQAALILAQAEEQAAEITKACEKTCADYRAEALVRAEKQAQADYEAALAKSREEAARYADGVLEGTDSFVSEIVGRITK